MFSESQFIDVTQYINSNMTIEEIEKIEMKKLKDNFISTHTENDYFLKITENKDNQAIFLFPNKNDGMMKHYDAITLKNDTIEFNKCDSLIDFNDKGLKRINDCMVEDAKELKNLAEETRRMADKLFDAKIIFPSDIVMPYFKSIEFKECIQFNEFYPNDYDKSKTLKGIINEINDNNEKKKENILRNLEIAKKNYIGNIFINKSIHAIIEIEDFFLKENIGDYSIIAKMNIIQYNSNKNNVDIIQYGFDECRNPHNVIIGIYEPLHMYKPLKEKEVFYNILDNIRKIESINKRFQN